MDFNLYLKFLILSTEFILYTVCLYNTPWYIRNHIIRSKNGKSAGVSIINFVHIPNKMLLKKPIGWLTASSVKECRTQCTAKLPTCISFNARRIVNHISQTSHLHCDFFDDDHYANQLFLIDADDVDYYAPKDECNTKDCDSDPIKYCEPRYKNGFNNSICQCRNTTNGLCNKSQVFNIHDGVPTYEMGVYQIIPPDWKYSVNVTVIQGIPNKKCKLVEFFDDSVEILKMLQVVYLDGEIKVKSKDVNFYKHSIVYNKTYSIEAQKRYQGLNSGGRNEYKFTVHIDGVEVSQETIQENLELYSNVKYHIAVNDVCTATVENPKFTIYEEEYEVALSQIYQNLYEMENQWLFAVKIAPEQYGSSEGTILWVTSTQIDRLVTMSLNEGKLKIVSIVDGAVANFDLTTTFPDKLSLNEFTTVKAYQIYDTFLEKYVIRIRANGTVIGTEEWISSPPPQYKFVKVYISGPYPSMNYLLSPYLLQLP